MSSRSDGGAGRLFVRANTRREVSITRSLVAQSVDATENGRTLEQDCFDSLDSLVVKCLVRAIEAGLDDRSSLVKLLTFY